MPPTEATAIRSYALHPANAGTRAAEAANARYLLHSLTPPLGEGDHVEVQNRFDGRWSSGFQVVDVLIGMGERRYRLRRLSDGEILPRLFEEESLTARRSA